METNALKANTQRSTRVEHTCPRCKLTKPITDFYASKSRHRGFKTYCKDCSKDFVREYRQGTAVQKKLTNVDKLNDSINHIADVVDHMIALKQQYLKGIK